MQVSRKKDFNVVCPFSVRLLVFCCHPRCFQWHQMIFVFTSSGVRLVKDGKSVMVQINTILISDSMVVGCYEQRGITGERRK